MPAQPSPTIHLDIIQQFINELLIKAGFSNLATAFLDDYKTKLAVEVQKRIGARALESLKGEDIEAYGELLDKNPSPQALADFFSSRIENFAEKFENWLAEFAADFAGKIQAKKIK